MTIALLTDFGLRDAYVGILKGVIHSIHPRATVVDIAHEIPPFDRAQAAFVLYQAYRFFPKKTVFVVIVDPGVGSSRRPLLVQTADYYFIGPDNGVLSLALQESKVRRIFELKNPRYFLPKISNTFHGRDMFAPVAAHLENGIDPKNFGPVVQDYIRLFGMEPETHQGVIWGKILGIDRFGSALTNLSRNFLKKRFPKLNFKVGLKGRLRSPLTGIHRHYEEGEPGEPILLFSSAGLLEICVNQGSAAKALGLRSGDLVRVI